MNSLRSSYEVKVYLHRINDGQGANGVSNELIYSLYELLEECYSGTDISFIWDCNIFDQNNEELYGNPTKRFSNSSPYFIFENYDYDHNDGIDIYIFNFPPRIGSTRGAANGIGNTTECFITLDGHTNTICHEVGHVLGLIHPFEVIYDIEEPVSRTTTTYINNQGNIETCISNGMAIPCCNILGDLCCDTPASKRVYEACVSSPDCIFWAEGIPVFGEFGFSHYECEAFNVDPVTKEVQFPVDNEGNQYDIATNNLMSVMDENCRIEFTPNQIQRMKYYLDNNPLTTQVLTTESGCVYCAYYLIRLLSKNRNREDWPDCLLQWIITECDLEQLVRIDTLMMNEVLYYPSENDVLTSITENIRSASTDTEEERNNLSSLLQQYQQEAAVLQSKQINSLYEIQNIITETDCLDEVLLDIMIGYEVIIEEWTDSLAAARMAELTTISRKCASMYGQGVHIARSILSQYEQVDYSVFDDCENLESRSNGSNMSSNLTYLIQPNPNSGEFEILLPIVENTLYTIDVMNISGQLIYHDQRDSGLQRISLNNVESGIYMVNLFVKNELVSTQKMIITP